jgi:hypothetical protein
VKSCVRTLGDLDADLVLAPERHLALSRDADGARGIPLGQLVIERTERALPSDVGDAVVLDTTHARDGLLDVLGAMRDGAGTKSAKKIARAGDLLVSRLRPYLRQIGYVHPAALALTPHGTICVSTEFYVLAPPEGESLAWLVPVLLGEGAQEALASAQEGGHHPRVPRASLFAMRVPHAAVRARGSASRAVEAALADHYRAARKLEALLRR